MKQIKRIRISADLAQAILDHLDDLGASTMEEYVDVREYLNSCRLAVALAAPSTRSSR